MAASDRTSELAPVRPVFRAVAATVIPRARELDEAGWSRLEEVVEDALGGRPPAMRRQLRVLLRALQWLPVLRWGRPFTALSFDARGRVLAALQDAPVLLLRRGFWGLRTLALMGFYGREESHAEVGYRAHLRGRRGRDEPVRGRGRGELPEETAAAGEGP